MKLEQLTKQELTQLNEQKLQRSHFEFIADTVGKILDNNNIPRTKAKVIAEELAQELKSTNDMFKEDFFIKRFMKSFGSPDSDEL